MKGQRGKFTGVEKVALLRRHYVEKVPVSEVCEQAGLQPTQFYQWQKQFFENGANRYDRKGTKVYLLLPGETEADSAGEKPRQWITRPSASARDAKGRGEQMHRSCQMHIAVDRPAMPQKTPPEERPDR